MRNEGGCGSSTYPRLDPAVIMLVQSSQGEYTLLGHNKKWQRGRFSLLAGFCEIAEALEAAVCREVYEVIPCFLFFFFKKKQYCKERICGQGIYRALPISLLDSASWNPGSRSTRLQEISPVCYIATLAISSVTNAGISGSSPFRVRFVHFLFLSLLPSFTFCACECVFLLLKMERGAKMMY